MAKIKFEVGKRYYDNYGKLHTCTKRTDKSVWFNGNRFNIRGYDVERTNGAYVILADNYDDIEVQRDKAMAELLKAVCKVCECEPCECIYENEEEIYGLCNELKDYLEEYVEHKVKLEGIDD